MLKKKKNNKGFTLIELLVVIAIIGILAVVAVPSLFKNINKAKASDAVAYINAVKTSAISEYASTQPTVPTTAEVIKSVEGTPDSITVNTTAGQENPAIVKSGDKLVLNVKLNSKDIASAVTKQLGSAAKLGDDETTVTVDIANLEATK